MEELVKTRHNPMIDPHLHIWEWQIPVYLFLGGLVAGMMIIAGYFIITGRASKEKSAVRFIPLAALLAISLGMGALFLDLEHKLYVWRMYLTFQWTSPMSWGAWILILVYPVLLLTGLLNLPEWASFGKLRSLQSKLKENNGLSNILAYLNMGIGTALGIYTGILLSAFVARPAWNTSILGILFLVSGISTAAALVHLIGGNKEEKAFLAKADNGFIVAEIVVLLLMLIGFAGSSEAGISGGKLFLGSDYTAPFWVFVMGMGLVIPLILQVFIVKEKISHTKLVPLFVLAGGLILRFVFVAAGQASHF